MRRIDKKVLILIMQHPCSLSYLVRETGWTKTGIDMALSRLQSAGDIIFDGERYCVNETPCDNVARRKSVEWPSAPSSIIKTKSVPDWFKNPPQPLPRRLREPKTRKRDRE